MKRLSFFMVTALWCFISLFADDVQITSVEYWIDDNHNSLNISSAMEFDVNCVTLPEGLHTLHYRVADCNGRYSTLQEHVFYKLPRVNKATKVDSLQYWWDDMFENGVIAPYTTDQFVLYTNALPYGLHSLKYRVKDDTGRWSELKSHYFYKGETLDSARIVSYSYWWNDLTENTITRVLDNPSITFELDDNFIVPHNARTGYAGHYTATLNFVFTDNRGHSALLSTNVIYPDNDAPVTDIDADKYVSSSTVKLTWTESSNDKMGDYNVYYSKDNGPFVLWLADTTLTTATFKGERGCIYIFTVTGRDVFGNREQYDEAKCVSVTFE